VDFGCNRKRQSTAALHDLAEVWKAFQMGGSVLEFGCALPL